jgi:hypothetical protein
MDLRKEGLKKPKILHSAEQFLNKLLIMINKKEPQRYLLILIQRLFTTDLIEILMLGMKVLKVLKYQMIDLLFKRINKIEIHKELT